MGAAFRDTFALDLFHACFRSFSRAALKSILKNVQKLKQVAAVVKGFIDAIIAIAGNAGAAAGKVESILAGLLSPAINFLAGVAGLGKVSDKRMGVVNKVRAQADEALDWLADTC